MGSAMGLAVAARARVGSLVGGGAMELPILPIVGRARVGSERRPALAAEDGELERSRGAKGTEADSEDEGQEEADACAPLSPLPAWEKRWAGHGKPLSPVSNRVPLSPNRATSPNRAASPPSPSIRGYSPLRRGGQPRVQNWSSDQNAPSDAGPQGCDQFV